MIRVGSVKQLFLDDHMVAGSQGVTRRFHRPTRYGTDPVILADGSWERGGAGVYLGGGTVLFDEEDKIFKMWYRTDRVSTDQTHRYIDDLAGNLMQKGGYKTCYAVSTDGIHWEKPVLGLTEVDGSKKNNVLPPAKAFGGWEQLRRPNIIKDYEEPDPARRYKMLYMDKFDTSPNQEDAKWGLCPGYSRDGIHWELVSDKAYFPQAPARPNGVLFGWDPRHKQYVHFHRESTTDPADVDGRRIRSEPACLRTTSGDFESWGGTEAVFRKGPSDLPGWSCAYLDGILYTPDLYVGYLAGGISNEVEDVPAHFWNEVYRWDSAATVPELTISRDGIKWSRVSPNWPAHRTGLWGTWDSEWIMPSKPIVYDGKVLIYYTGSNVPSKAHRPDHPQRDLLMKKAAKEYVGQAIGLATMRVDGFGSMEAYDAGGTVTTPLLTFKGDRLIINARAPERSFEGGGSFSPPFGQVAVEILDAKGAPIADRDRAACDQFSGDFVAHTVTWAGNFDLRRLTGLPIRLRFHLKNAALYSFQFRKEKLERDITNLLEPGSRGHA